MENKITIGFEYTNEFGDHYKAKSTFEPFMRDEDDELRDIGEAFNNFLRQIGLLRDDSSILTEGLTRTELAAVKDRLRFLRVEVEV